MPIFLQQVYDGEDEDFILSIFIIIFLTDAMEVIDEDINSPLVFYLLAKLQ